MASRKVLIIYLGQREVLGTRVRRSPSLGDVFWTTPILHLFREDRVTWLTVEEAFPLLAGNPLIERVLFFNLYTVLQLLAERFDVLVNLEREPGVSALADKISATERFGFCFNPESGQTEPLPLAAEALKAVPFRNPETGGKTGMAILFEMLGQTFAGERAVLGYRPRENVTRDIGFNTEPENSRPYQNWPPENWRALEHLIGGKYQICYQPVCESLYAYMDWIYSCKLMITNDGLGFHLAQAMGKKVIGLLGPMPAMLVNERPGELIVLTAERSICSSGTCRSSLCINAEFCLKNIEPPTVLAAVDAFLAPPASETGPQAPPD